MFPVQQPEIKTTLFRKHRILNKNTDYQNVVSMLNVLQRAKANMTKPLMFHFVSGVDVDLFQTDGFIQRFKECFESEVKRRNKQRKKNDPNKRPRNKLPTLEMIYSIEAKPSKKKDGDLYTHIHIMLIIDSLSRYGDKELTIIVNKTLARIKGLDKWEYEADGIHCVRDGVRSRYGALLKRDHDSRIKATDKYLNPRYHDLKLEFNDAVIRASYLCKTTQKALLPERFKKMNFNVTRIKRNSANDDWQQVA